MCQFQILIFKLVIYKPETFPDLQCAPSFEEEIYLLKK